MLFCASFIFRHFLLTCLCFALPTYSHGADEVASFLAQHWPQVTIPLQGKPPGNLSELENNLSAEACGTCHQQQFQEWQNSLHSKAMGPGVLGQILGLRKTDPDTAKLCWRCHTPLAEQQPILIDDNGVVTQNRQYSQTLNHSGLVCAACHVRNHRRFGPPKKGINPKLGLINDGTQPHNGFVASVAFQDSRFCSHCHQFSENDYALNGKLLENTFLEWKQSRYAKEGVQCQDCHMPDRQHSWRGIHDVDMVKQAVTIAVSKLSYIDNKIVVHINVKNTGAGHYFPTYVTPRVEVSAVQLDKQQKEIKHTRQVAMIGREVTADLSEELYDTRIPPDDFVDIEYRFAVDASAYALQVSITVYPDYFYERFYRLTLGDALSSKANSLIQEAHKRASSSSFSLFKQELKIDLNRISLAHPTRLDEKRFSDIDQEQTVDWNAGSIEWADYEAGLKRAKQVKKPVMLFLYANWCPTCHSYKSFFYRDEVVALSEKFVMVRANVDERPDLSELYNLDGEYVPRILTLNSFGKIQMLNSSPNKKHMLFYSADEGQKIISIMNKLLKNI